MIPELTSVVHILGGVRLRFADAQWIDVDCSEKVMGQISETTILPSNYLELVSLAERLHRQFLDLIQVELDAHGIRDINSVQALILHNIGDTEMTASELMWRGCYLGSNVSYNLKKLTEAGYLTQTRSAHDRRVTMVRASQKGADLCAILKTMNDRHLEALSNNVLKGQDVLDCVRTLHTLQQYWSRAADPRRERISLAAAAAAAK